MFHGIGPGGFGPGLGGGGVGFLNVILMVFWVLVIFLIIFVVIRLIIFAVAGMGRHGHGYYSPMNHDALDIAKERYAKGEIDEKEFNQIKKNLS